MELVCVILSHVDELSLACCRFVCHRWKTLSLVLLVRKGCFPLPPKPLRLTHSSPQKGDATMRRRSIQAPPNFSAKVAALGWLEVLQWARANGCHWDEWTCANAAAGGHLKVLQWAHANGCPWDTYTCTFAAKEGHKEVLQWAQRNGCYWDGSVRRVQWCRGCDEPTHTVRSREVAKTCAPPFYWTHHGQQPIYH